MSAGQGPPSETALQGNFLDPTPPLPLTDRTADPDVPPGPVQAGNPPSQVPALALTSSPFTLSSACPQKAPTLTPG